MDGPLSQRIETARDMLRRSRTIVSFSGAGLSAESGVPTFREAGDEGMWARYDPMRLASPQGFAADPELVIEWYAHRRRAIAAAAPNAAHLALAGCDGMRHITQNVDDLLHRAGTASIVQLHGTIARDRCHGACGREEGIDLAAPPGLRACPVCGERMRPAVVWFGESLPTTAWETAERACSACDIMLVVGTSGAVYPAAGLIGLAKSRGAAIIIVNTQASDASGYADVELLGPAGEIVPRLLAPQP